ncbi:MAG TPA: M20/M25/M40 family metallo-hydrolase, partial [Candidatus Brocadiia bacterium]|nr:M20/M25/M40 family metallo-hydrolase [Candidatus Brocadiia bacterium]
RVAGAAEVYERGGMLGPKGRSWQGRDNVIAEWVLGNGRGPAFLLNNHMDTVGTEGMTIAPFDPQVRDGRIYGRGSTDTKGNLAVGMAAVAALREVKGLNGRVVIESVVDEECNGSGAGTLACCLAGVTGDYVICLDGSGEGVYVGCNGIVSARVVARGEAGHSSQGVSVNAIDKGIVVKQAVDAFAALRARERPDCMVNVGVFRAGTLPAIVPGEAELQMNLGYHADEAAEAERQGAGWGGALFRKRFEEAMAALPSRDPWFARKPAEVSWIKDLYPARGDANSLLVREAVKAASEVAGRPVEAFVLSAWGDVAHLARQLKAQVAGMGSGAPGAAHSAGEYVVIEDLVRGAKAVALTMMRLMRDEIRGATENVAWRSRNQERQRRKTDSRGERQRRLNHEGHEEHEERQEGE